MNCWLEELGTEVAGDDSTEDRMLTQDEPEPCGLGMAVAMNSEAFLHHPRHALDFYCAAPSDQGL